MRPQIIRLCTATIVVLTVAVLVPFVASAQSQSSQVRVFQSGVHIDNFPLPNGLTLRYAISIPKNYSDSPVPLVLALHYGGSPNGAAQGVMLTLVQPALADLGAIIVAPESLRGAWDTAQNEQGVNALLAAVEAAYRIDAKRVAVTGFSMGGTGVWFFAGKYPERFSAAIPVAGMPPASAANWKTPVFAVHSRSDQVLPIGPTQARIAELRSAGVQAELVVLNGIAHHETQRFTEGLRRAVPWLKGVWK